jgi:uncharacterized protein YbjT (DUF2867 family)
MKKRALLIGATGATGRSLLGQLIDHDDYEFIHILHYRATSLDDHAKVTEHVLSFESLADFHLEDVDDVFCCIGTTIKKAGSQEAFKKVDKDYVVELGKWAKANQVKGFHVISYLGADKDSSIFYNRVKGEMEAALKEMNLRSLYIYHPPLLKAKRNEFRLGEKLGDLFLSLLAPLMLGGMKKHRPLPVEKLALAMLEHALEDQKGIHIVSSEEMQDLKMPERVIL